MNFTNIHIITLPHLLNDEYKHISDSFVNSSKNLNNLLNQVQVCSFDKNPKDTYYLDILESGGIHSPDDEILLDSFKCSKSLNEIIFFITMDGEILNFRRKISELFDYKVYVSNPKDYLNN